MGSMVPLPINTLVFSKSAHNANLLKIVMLQLEQKKVSGYLHIQGKKADGYLFLRYGQPFNARFSAKTEAGNKYLIGSEAARALNDFCCDNSHHLSIYVLEPNVTNIISGMTTGQDKHKRLSTEFVDIQKFDRHLRESAFEGYMHVRITGTNRCAVCAYKQGRASESIFYPFKKNKVLSKIGQWQMFISEAQERGAIFSVFESVETDWSPVKFGFIPNVQTHMPLLSDIFTICENIFSNRNSNAGFEELFVDACIQITDEYPFMHPFDNEVRYEQGILEIGENLEFALVLKALNKALEEVFQMLGRNGSNLLEEVRAHIRELVEEDETDEFKKFIVFLPLFNDGSQQIQ